MSIGAAQPITIHFEDISNQPVGFEQRPPFTWRGVEFSGGALQRHFATGNTWYRAMNRNLMTLKFPPGSTDISFEVDGLGQSIMVLEYMPIQVWAGPIGSTLVKALPLPAVITDTYPPKHKVEIDGPASVITIFTAEPPSGVDVFTNVIHLDNVRYTPPDLEPTIIFDSVLPKDARVLTHNYGAYPFPSSLQTQDGAIRVHATVTVNNQPAPNRTIHFRLIDPPDTAGYVIQAGDASVGDNVDGPGKLNGQPAATAVSDGAGRVSITLNVTSFAAGDNYQLEASGNATFTCPSACARSAVYTAWKRIYVEYNKMFRRGAFLTKDAPVGAMELEVDDLNGLPTPPFVVRLLHAAPVSAPSGDFATEETASVVDVQVDPSAPTGIFASIFGNDPLPGKLLLDPSSPGLQRDYSGPELIGKVRRAYMADAVGVVTGNRAVDFLLANGRLVNGLMDQAFAEYVWLTDAAVSDPDLLLTQPRIPYDGVVPRKLIVGGEGLDEWQEEWLTRKWLRQATRVGDERIAHANHQALFTTGRFWHQGNNSTELGLTVSASRFSESWLAITTIGGPNRIAEATAHELAHQWRVNHGGTNPKAGGGHCGTVRENTAIPMVGSANEFCVMTADIFEHGEAGDGTINFHYKKFSGAVDSEYLRIRRRAEPMPQNDQTRPKPQ